VGFEGGGEKFRKVCNGRVVLGLDPLRQVTLEGRVVSPGFGFHSKFEWVLLAPRRLNLDKKSTTTGSTF
jgi:hypothetical protein